VSPLTGIARRKGTERWTLRRDGDRWKLAALTGSALDDGLAAAAAFELAAADHAPVGGADPLLVHASETAAGALPGSAPVEPTRVEPLAVRPGRLLLGVDAMRWKLVADASRPGGWRLDAVS
jgi:hypothetical protein